MRWFLNRKVEYYPFDVYLVGHGYTNEMKRDFGWAFKNVFFYYIDSLEYSYRSARDMELLKKYYKKRFNTRFVQKFSLVIKQRSEKMLSLTKKCFGKEADFIPYLPKLFKGVCDLLAVFQLPELAQNLIPEADKKLLRRFGLSREAAVKKLLAAEKIWRGRLGEKLGLSQKQALMLLPEEVLNYARGGKLPKNFYKRKRAVILFFNGKEKVFWNKEADNFFKREAGNIRKEKNSELTGNPAYPGIVTGPAFVALRPSDFKNIPQGAILVCSTTRYDVVPYLKRVKGIVADQGGITSHASIVSRELKIPTIVGTKNGTDSLKTGDKIKLDAGKGKVIKL
ncbi:MAG: PEP-utilizing enzyme [Patescibacteria group bacterium]|nr:PEP-utilizing enzyme [Patescibacteria group bacterium]MDD5554596.1 PEP-utilizing enzyme [Patescibacteria group bacterium]